MPGTIPHPHPSQNPERLPHQSHISLLIEFYQLPAVEHRGAQPPYEHRRALLATFEFPVPARVKVFGVKHLVAPFVKYQKFISLYRHLRRGEAPEAVVDAIVVGTEGVAPHLQK